MLRIRNIILPIVTIIGELSLHHDKNFHMSGLQTKILHQSNAQLLPTIVYGVAAIALYSTYDRYLMEIRLIFDYLTLSLRCTRGLSPLEEQTYICEAINLHACRETLVLELREKADRDLRQKERMERERIQKQREEAAKAAQATLSRFTYVHAILPIIVAFLRLLFGLKKIAVDEENIPPSIRTGIEKQKDDLRICAAKSMCCNIQKHFKDKSSILPNCLQGISRGKINLCELKENNICAKNFCGKSRAQSPVPIKQSASMLNNNCSYKAQMNSMKKEEMTMENCKRETDDRSAKKMQEKERKEKEKCEREIRAQRIKMEKEKRKMREKQEECEENDATVSIFNELPRTDLVMNCEIKRVLDADCQEVLRCKEVVVPPPICKGEKTAAAKSCGFGSIRKTSSGPARPGSSPIGQPFGTATNCSQMGMAQRMQPLYQCANSVLTANGNVTCGSGTGTGSVSSSSCTTNSPPPPVVVKKQMDGACSSVSQSPSVASTPQFDYCAVKQEQQSQCQAAPAQVQQCKMEACSRMANSQGNNNSSFGMGSAYVSARSQPPNKTSVQAIPVQVTLRDSCVNDTGGGRSSYATADNFRSFPSMNSTGMGMGMMPTMPLSSTMNQSSGSGYRTANTSSFGNGSASTRMVTAQQQQQCCPSANSFSNAGAATPLEAQTKKAGCDYCPITIPEDTACNRQAATSLHPCIKCASVKCTSNTNSCGGGGNSNCGCSNKNYNMTTSSDPFKTATGDSCSCDSTNFSLTRPRNVGSIDMLCQLKGGAEEGDSDPPQVEETYSATQSETQTPNESPRGGNNKLTETKREVMKTVTNIDDPSGKVIRKERDTVIEEILQSSAVPGETKTMREVTVQRNIIQEANKTIREESHNTREEIINFEVGEDNKGHENLCDAFESRQQRLNAMRRMSRGPPMNRHVSEERCIYGRLKGSPDWSEVQSEVCRSRMDNHQMGLKGGSEKRGQSEVAQKTLSEENIKRVVRPHSTGANYDGRGDFSREFSAHLESSPYGERLRDLKTQLVHQSKPEEMEKTLEQIVLLQTEALMSFVPRERLKNASQVGKGFNADLSYNALMKELKSVMKADRSGSTVTKYLHDIDNINEEIEREMKQKMGVQQYERSKGTNYPNHQAFAALIRELREKIQDYEDGNTSRSDEENETQEQRRQRIEVLRDELEKRKQMLGLTSKRSSGDEVRQRGR